MPTVLAQDFSACDWEVIVVVDGSRDGSVEYLRSLKPACKLTIIQQTNGGSAAARNVGVNGASGDLVLLLDDDIVCDTKLVRTHVAAHDGRDSAVVTGRVIVSPDSPRSLATELIRRGFEAYATALKRSGRPRSPYEVWVPANSSLPRSLFLRVGGCDETLRRGHDDDLTIRLWNAGASFHFEPAALAWQYYVKTSAELVTADGPINGRSEVFLGRRHPGYRPSSRLAHLMRPSAATRFGACVSCRSPASPELLLRPPCWAAEKLMSIPFFRQAGIHLLGRRIAVTVLRAAAAEAGSWQALRRELGTALPALRYHRVGRHAGPTANWLLRPSGSPSRWSGWRATAT